MLFSNRQLWLVLYTFCLILLLITGCNDSTAELQSPTIGQSTISESEATTTTAILTETPVVDVFFPQQAPVDGDRIVMLSYVVGEFIKEDRCLRVVSNSVSNPSYLIVWPPGVQPRLQGETIQIITDAGELLFQVGDQIWLSGGQITDRNGAESRQPLSAPIPDECPGSYWVVGDEFRRN